MYRWEDNINIDLKKEVPMAGTREHESETSLP